MARRSVVKHRSDSGVLFTPLPDEFKVVDEKGRKIDGNLYVSTETFDPWHVMVDVTDL